MRISFLRNKPRKERKSQKDEIWFPIGSGDGEGAGLKGKAQGLGKEESKDSLIERKENNNISLLKQKGIIILLY